MTNLVLGRSLRAMIVLPAVVMTLYFGFGTASGALTGMFAVVAMLLMADFGGRPLRRLISYTVTAGIGCLTLALGTVVNGHAVLVVVTGMILGFAVNLTGVLRGPIAKANLPVLLPFMTAAVAPDPRAAFGYNLLGWVFGCAASIAAALLLWPTRSSRALYEACASALDEASAAIAVLYPVRTGFGTVAVGGLDTAVRALNGTYDGRLMRPAGTIGRDRGLVNLVEDIHRLRAVLTVRAHDPNPTDSSARGHLADATEATLAATAAALRSGEDTIDLEPLRDARRQSYHELEVEVGEALAARDPSAHGKVTDHFSVRLASMLALAAATDAKASLGSKLPDPRIYNGVADVALPRWQSDPEQMLLAQLNPSSPWFRNSARQAVAIGLSLLVAIATGVSHGFWVVLGSISSLRYDAVGTGRTVRDAFVGTALGFVGGSAVLYYFSGSFVLWLLLPPLAFLGAYTRARLGLWVSQFAFTMLVITALAAMSPEEHGLATVRLIDVSLGLAISLLCSILLWPRGILPAVRQSLQVATTSSTSLLLASVDRMVGGAVGADDLEERLSANWRSLTRAAESFDLALIERTPEDIPRRSWVRVAGIARHVTYAATLLSGYPAMPERDRFHTRVIGPLLAATHAVQRSIDASTKSLLDAVDEALEAGLTADSREWPDPQLADPEVADRLGAKAPHLEDLRSALDAAIADWSTEVRDDPESSDAVVPMVLELEQALAWLEHLELASSVLFARAKLIRDAVAEEASTDPSPPRDSTRDVVSA